MTLRRPLRIVTEPQIFTGQDADTGEQYLLRIYDDGTHTLATRVDSSATWGPEVEFAPSDGAWSA